MLQTSGLKQQRLVSHQRYMSHMGQQGALLMTVTQGTQREQTPSLTESGSGGRRWGWGSCISNERLRLAPPHQRMPRAILPHARQVEGCESRTESQRGSWNISPGSAVNQQGRASGQARQQCLWLRGYQQVYLSEHPGGSQLGSCSGVTVLGVGLPEETTRCGHGKVPATFYRNMEFPGFNHFLSNCHLGVDQNVADLSSLLGNLMEGIES